MGAGSGSVGWTSGGVGGGSGGGRGVEGGGSGGGRSQLVSLGCGEGVGWGVDEMVELSASMMVRFLWW